jgi:uncharacterized membrane protein
MENQPSIFNNPNEQQVLPNSTAVLVLGIISIVGCFCYGVVGTVCGIVALVLANKGAKLYEMNPGMYKAGSYGNLKAGKICAIIGTILSALYLVLLIVIIAVIGIAGLSHPDEFLRSLQH